MKYDLNKPAFGPGAETPESEATPVVEADAEIPEEVKPIVEEVPEPSEEESKVPYSRFKKFHDRATEAEREAAYWRGVAEGNKSPVEEPESKIPDFWVELYGDSEASQRAWKIQSEQNESLKREAVEEAKRAILNERQADEERTEQNIEVIDQGFEQLTDKVGRDLTEKEQSALLDIVDEFTPKGEDGNYLGQILPFEKAWEIYELKQLANKAPIAKARDSVAQLTGSQTQGDVNLSEKDKNFNPSWGSLSAAIRDRLG